MAFSTDGRWLSITNITGTVQLWDTRLGSNQPVASFESGSAPTAIAVSADGQWLAAAAVSGFVRLWQVAAQAEPEILVGHEGPIAALQFSPQSNRLVSAGDDASVRIWDITGPEQSVVVLRGHGSPVTAIAFDGSTHRLATGDQAGTVLIWEWEKPLARPTTIRGHQGRVDQIAFSADQRWLATAQDAGPVLLWHDRVDGLIEIACQAAGRNLTAQEWRLFLGEQAYRPTCPNLPAPEIRNRYRNHQVVDAFLAAGRELNQDGWELLTRSALFETLFDPGLPYAGPEIVTIPVLSAEEKEVVLRKLAEHAGQFAAATDHLWQNRDLFTVPLAPPPAKQVVVTPTADAKMQQVAATWNRYGGLLAAIANQLQIDPNLATALFTVEASGQVGVENQRLTIRFENHLFYNYWGKMHPELFNRHFSFDPQVRWQGHRWRPNVEAPWQEFHGDQAKEWEVFEFARKLDESAAMQSISMGAAQIMGFNYSGFGYSSVQDMLAIQLDPGIGAHSEIMLLFEFLKVNNLVDVLRAGDLRAFTRTYNGAGQAENYAALIRQAQAQLIALRYPEGDYQLFEPEALSSTAQDMLADSRSLTQTGEIEATVQNNTAAMGEDPDAGVSPADWSQLCRNGIVNGDSAGVLDYCESAVGRNPPNLILREDLAIARMLSGDRELAIHDYEYIVSTAKQREAAAAFVQQREAWLTALKAGQNPFTPEVLNRLFPETGQN